MRKTVLGLVVGALIATGVSTFANNGDSMMPQQNMRGRSEANFRVTSGGEAKSVQLNNTQYNTQNENGRPPYVEGYGCCTNGQNGMYRN